MLIQKKKRYILSASLFVFLCVATIIGFILLKQNQDNRQQASTGNCPASEPYCDALPSTVVPSVGSDLSNKGIVSTTYTGDRPATEESCNSVWMNNFCYMPGDEFAGGLKVVDSGRYGYAYIENKQVAESLAFGAENVSEKIGTTENLGEACGGKGFAIDKTCYAYGAAVNGYLVMPARTSNCNNATGDYCYAHLKKIEVPYQDWQAAVSTYEQTGETKVLEELYKKTYGISFEASALYDPTVANANLLKAQAILSALTNASVLQQKAAAQNAALSSKGNLSSDEQALFDFNLQIINDKNLDKRYQILDQISDSTSQQTTINTAVKKMYSDLVVTGSDNDLNKIANQKFKEIFGYDPSEKYGNVNGILTAFGIDPDQLNRDRDEYAKKIAEAVEKQKQSIENQDQPVKNQAQQISYQDQMVDKKAEASLTDAEKNAPLDLASLYKFYTGNTPNFQMLENESYLQKEVARYDAQAALSFFAKTQDVTYLNQYYLNNFKPSQSQMTSILSDPKNLLMAIYGEQGRDIYRSIVIPNKFNSAVDNFVNDGGKSLISVCKELNMTNCQNIGPDNATSTVSIMLDQMYKDRPEVNVAELAVQYANKIATDGKVVLAQKEQQLSNLSRAYQYAVIDQKVLTKAQQDYQTALAASKVFNSFDTFNFATEGENRQSLSDRTWGLTYGNALMQDNISNRAFSTESMKLNFLQTIDLTFNQLISQIAGVDVAQNIATNYESQKYYNYAGPADTTIANVALMGANNLGKLDYKYQAAQKGYYFNKDMRSTGEWIGNLAVQAGAYSAAAQMNDTLLKQSMYTDKQFSYIDPVDYAKKASDEFLTTYKKETADQLYKNYISNVKNTVDNVDKLSFEKFLEDPEIRRSSQELNYEVLEKVVAPSVAIVALPVLIAGAAPALALGVASTGFSLYQGSGMKAQALEIQRIDIQSRENAIVKSYIENGASPQEINDLKADLDLQVETLNKQGNLMLANSAVAAFTSAGGLLTTAAGAASTANAAVNVIATSGQILTKAGQVGGIAMNSYNAVNSGISSYNALNQGNYAQAGMSALSSFIAASGVAGNTFGLVGSNTYTNKIDYVLDAMNVPAGAAVDAQQVAQACYGSSGAFSEKDCTNAWIGLALSAGQNVSQISSSYKNYKSDTDIARVTDIQKQIDAIDTEILALNGPNKGLREGLQINDLVLQRTKLADQIASIDPNIKMAKNVVATEELLAGGARVSAGIEVELNRIIDAGKVAESKYTTEVEAARNAGENAKVEFLTNQEAARQARQAEQVEYLNKQLEVFRDRPSEIAAVRDQITAIDEQISKRGVLLSETEVNDLQQQRNSLVGNLEGLVRDLSSVESLRTQNEAILKTVQENKALEDYQALLAADAAKAELLRQYAPENEEVGKYATEVEADQNLVRLETDPSKRLLSIAYLQDNLAKISDLETQKQELMINLGVENSQQVGRAIDRLSTEINELRNQGVLNEADTLRLADLETRRSDLQAETVKLEAIDSEIAGIRKITDTYSADSRSVFQKIADFFSPGKANREAYYKSMDLTRQAEELRTKLGQVGADSDDAKSLREKLADVNRQLLDQQSILASAVSAKSSKNIIQRVAEFFANRTETGQVNDLKKLAKKLGTRNLEVVDQINAKSAEIEKLRSEDALANEVAIKNLETEIATLRQEAASALKGNALISVDQSGEHTQYKVTEAGKKLGLNDEQLLVLNDELKNFEEFKRVETGIADFKIYSNTGSFKDQDVFLLAEIEAFGVGRRGTVFGALPGMGKTDVVMPFNVLLKQRLTGESQFVVFPEAKLMKPWVSDANYTPNKAFIDYVESRFGEGSVVIVKANDQNIDPVAIANAKFVITTKDVAFDLQNTSTRLGLNLRNKWKNSFVHADEVDWTFNPNENYKLSGAQVAIRDKAEFSLYADAQRQVIGIDENGQLVPGKGLSSLGSLINELSVSKSIPKGIARTSDGKGGKFADPELEKQVLTEWLDTWNGQSKIVDLDLSADVATVRQKINNYLTNSTDSDVHQHRAELAMINETVNFLSRVPGEDYGLTSNTKSVNGVDETINSIAPREQGRVSGRSYSAVAESLLYNTLGARVLGVNDNVDLNKITVGESGSEINYALLMLESKGFSLYTGTPETVAKLYKMAYGIDLKIFTDSAVDDSIARFNAPPSGTASKVFVNLQDQILARLAENRNQVFINMASGLRSNEAALNDLAKTVIDTNAPYKKVLVIGANGELNEYQIVGSTLNKVATYPSTDDLNARTKQLDTTGERYIKFYEYGAHVGVDTANDVDISRAIGLCSGCDQTTFSQGINRVRVKVSPNGDGTSSVKYAPIDIVWLDAPSTNRNPNIKDFSASINERQTVNEALAEVSFKETLLKNSVDATFAELIDLARNGKKGFLGFGSYKVNSDLATQLEAAQQKWKETTGMNYLLGSDNMTAQAKLEKTASQVAATYEELTKMLTGSGEPAKLLAKRADGAVGNNQIRLSFAGDEGYQVLGENPSYRQIVDLINQSSKHLEGVKIAFVDRSSPAEVVANEVARTADNKTEAETADTNVVRDADTADTDINKVGDSADTTKGNDQVDVNNNAGNKQSKSSNIGFATFVSNLWNGKVDEVKLLAENADVVEKNKQVILTDYQNKIDALKENLDKATEQSEKDSLNSQINDLETAKNDESNVNAVAEQMTTEQLADNYRGGGLKNWLPKDAERGGTFTVNAQPVADFLAGLSGGFNEEAFVADKQDEIDLAANQLKQSAIKERLANRLTNIYSDYDLSHKLATLYKNIVPRDYFSKKLANLQSSSEKLSNSLAERIRLTWNDSSKKIQSVFNNSKQRASSALLATRGFFVNQTNRFSDFVKSLSKPTNNQQVASTNDNDDGAGKTIIFSNVNSVKLTTVRDLSIDQIKAMNPDKVSEVSYNRNSTPNSYPSRDSISRNVHAKVSVNKNTGVLSIVDEKSTNGTYINGFRVAANTAYLLRDGDHVGIGIVPVSGGFKNAIELIVRTDNDGNYYLVDVNNYLKPQFFAVDRNNLDNTITLDQTDFIQLPSSKDTKNIIYSTEVVGRKTATNITDSRISREHLLVYHGNDGSLFVEDNNSSNGTFLIKNGTNNKVKLTKGEVAELVPGDRIYLDSYELKVVYDKNAKAYVLVNNANQLVKGAFVDAYESSKERDAARGQNILSDDMREHLNNWGGIGTVVEDLVTKFSYTKLNQIWLYGPGSQKGRRTSVTTSGGEKISLQYKLHFAVAVEDFDEALAEMTAYLRTLDVLHKVAPGKLIVTDTNSKQFGKAITIYAQDTTIMELIANKSVELGKKYKGINAGEMARVGANLDYEVEVPGTNGLLYYTLENVYKNEFGGEVAYYLGGGRGGVYLDNQYYQGYASRKTLMNMFWGKGPLDSWINKNKDRFNSLCSDCEQVRSQTQNGVQLADNLLTEAENLNKQATEAKTAGNLKLANDLTKQADAKKQAALKQLNDTRFQVVNSHGMQNQCVQLYLNAWVNTREALIRKTRADVDNAIDSVYDATVLAETMLDSKKMSVKQGGFFGFGAKEEIKDLSDLELGQVNDLLLGNDALGIEGLNSFALFAKNDKEITRVIIGGSLMKLDNSVVGNNPINPVRVYLRNFYRDAKNTILFGKNEKIVIQAPKLKLILPKINISKLRTVGGVVGDVTIKGWEYTSNRAQRFYGLSKEFIKGIEVGKSTTKIIGAANIWFKSILPKSNTTPVNTPVAINVSVTPVVSITVTPSITNSPSPTFTPSPTPATENDKDGEDFLRKLINGLSKTNFMGALWKFGIFMAADLLTKGEELGILTLELNEYKNALPPYDPSSEKSQKLAAMGIYEDYVCHNGDAYSKDLTKKSDNLSQMGDCKSGCYKGACLAKIGDSCDGGKIIFAAKTNKCLLSCKSGKLVESNSCGHADVEAYSNKAYWEVYQSLGTIPEETLNDTKVYMYATWNNSLNGGSAIAFAMSAGINIRPAVIGGGYANSPEVVVHEYFHLWGGQEYRWYPDWAPFATLFAIPERIIYALFHTTDVSVPRDYVDLLGYKVETYKEYNSKDNIFYYSNHNYPITGYGGLLSEKIQISEDFADSAAWYVNKSCELKSKSQIRYDYFKNNVFGGIEYLPDGGCDN